MRIVADANIPFVRECFSSAGEVQVLSGRDITPSAVADADALLVRSITPVNEALLAGSPVQFVGTATIGFDHVDVPYLRSRDIGFASAPGSNANSAAEYIVAALLEVGQKYRIALEGGSIGVIGVGNVGSRVARKCEALGMRVLRNDPPLCRQTGDPVYVPIEALYECDVITIHTPLTRQGIDKTFHLADAAFFSSLRAGAVFLNASRGAVVDTEALKAAIQSRRLRAVVLDVWEGEPCVDVALLEKVDLGTPHIAGYSYDGKIAGMIMIYKTFCDYFGLPPRFSAADFLPAPEVPRLTLHVSDANDEELLARAVRQVYDVRRDDQNLRRVVQHKPGERGRFFDALRKNYPIRREFQNTTVVLDERRPSLAGKLRGIGFKCDAESSARPAVNPQSAIIPPQSQSAALQWPAGRLDFSPGCLIMGILNVTPDSFSDGGEFFEFGRAVDRGLNMAREGAAVIDVGGESTRPGARPMPAAEQIRRVVPVIEALAERTRVPISIDTHDVEVARAALEAGAAIINDITALADERMAELAAGREVPVVLMHMQGTPATMQVEPTYADVVAEVRGFLVERAGRAVATGIPQERLFIDPGIGFGKTLDHNLLLLKNLDQLVATGYRVLVGPSRKAFIGRLTGAETPADRVFGTAAAVALCAAAGVSLVRVHDVAAMRDVLKVTRAILSTASDQ
jgi:erythronate-4-phosphate dehydrogenase